MQNSILKIESAPLQRHNHATSGKKKKKKTLRLARNILREEASGQSTLVHIKQKSLIIIYFSTNQRSHPDHPVAAHVAIDLWLKSSHFGEWCELVQAKTRIKTLTISFTIHPCDEIRARFKRAIQPPTAGRCPSAKSPCRLNDRFWLLVPHDVAKIISKNRGNFFTAIFIQCINCRIVGEGGVEI